MANEMAKNARQNQPSVLDTLLGGAIPNVEKELLLAGEIADLSAAVERLSGYRRTTITEVKTPDGRQRRRTWIAVLPVFHPPLGPCGSAVPVGGGHRVHDLILAMSSYEANRRRPAAPQEQKAQLVKKAQK